MAAAIANSDSIGKRLWPMAAAAAWAACRAAEAVLAPMAVPSGSAATSQSAIGSTPSGNAANSKTNYIASLGRIHHAINNQQIINQ